MVLCLKFVLAFCSLSYELLLAQSLSAFLPNTALRYSITIGLYLFAMGMGAFFIDKKMKNPYRNLWKTEMLLTCIGALSLPSLFLVEGLIPSNLAFGVWAHGLLVDSNSFSGVSIATITHTFNYNKYNNIILNEILINYIYSRWRSFKFVAFGIYVGVGGFNNVRSTLRMRCHVISLD